MELKRQRSIYKNPNNIFANYKLINKAREEAKNAASNY